MDEEWFKAESRRVLSVKKELEFARRDVRAEKAELNAARQDHEHAVQAQSLIASMAKEVQQQVHKRISAVVSSCLAAVFDDPYELKIDFEQKRGRTEARLKFSRDGNDVSPMDASGGGAVDVAAFALRAACLVLHRPRLRRLLVLDEPFKFVSEGFQPAIRSMLEQISRDLKIQIIMVTHNEAYETGKVIEL